MRGVPDSGGEQKGIGEVQLMVLPSPRSSLCAERPVHLLGLVSGVISIALLSPPPRSPARGRRPAGSLGGLRRAAPRSRFCCIS